MAMVSAVYVLITVWQHRNACAITPELGCYNVRDPLDLAFVAAATAGACIGGRGDRKSTRLNSSHVAISYAVFCLKKKNHHPSGAQERSGQACTATSTVSLLAPS